MLKKYLFIFCFFGFFTITGCDNAGVGDDLKKDFNRSNQEYKITVRVYDSKFDMQKAQAQRLNESRNSDLMGWSEWAPDKPEYGCVIHVTEPRGQNDGTTLETWGHELTHCIYGQFHDAGE